MARQLPLPPRDADWGEDEETDCDCWLDQPAAAHIHYADIYTSSLK